MADRDGMVTLRLTKPEALALLNAAETGLAVIEALNLVKATGLTQATVRKLRMVAMWWLSSGEPPLGMSELGWVTGF